MDSKTLETIIEITKIDFACSCVTYFYYLA